MKLSIGQTNVLTEAVSNLRNLEQKSTKGLKKGRKKELKESIDSYLRDEDEEDLDDDFEDIQFEDESEESDFSDFEEEKDKCCKEENEECSKENEVSDGESGSENKEDHEGSEKEEIIEVEDEKDLRSSGEIKKLQIECDKLRTEHEVSKGIIHKVLLEEKRLFVCCSHCKYNVACGFLKQGLVNFKKHIATDIHTGKMTDNIGCKESALEAIAKSVISRFDAKVYLLKQNKIFCGPCKQLFNASYSENNLEANIRQHENSESHKKNKKAMKGTKRISDMFVSNSTKKPKLD